MEVARRLQVQGVVTNTTTFIPPDSWRETEAQEGSSLPVSRLLSGSSDPQG